MDIASLKQTIETCELQVKQVDQALEASGWDNEELQELRKNLLEVIELTSESLLSLTKATALQSLESSPHAASSQEEDEEYAAFQAALGQDLTTGDSKSDYSSTNSSSAEGCAANSCSVDGFIANSSSAEDKDIINDTDNTHNLDDIIGTCVRAPYSHSWGGYQYHNAAIISLDADNEQVRVMYCNPTHVSMKVCPYYLRGTCRYTEAECKLSHGHLVHIDELREYEPTDERELSVGDRCMAKFTDDLWYNATVVDKHGEDFLQVLFDDYGDTTHAVEKADVIVLNGLSDSGSSSSEEEQEGPSESAVEDVPTYLWRPGDTEQLAEWETHTRGIGSKLMAAMGYRAGEGLGKVSQGRVEPVPILKLPPGKSLDRIMELKRRTGNADMFDVMKKKKIHKLKAAAAMRPKKSAEMFEYLNKSLGHGRKVDFTTYRGKVNGGSKPEVPVVISKQQLNKKSDKSINIQVIQTEEEVAKVEREILSIKQRLEANVTRRDTGGVKHLTEKLGKAEKYLLTLKNSHRELNRHRGQREGRKKLMIF